MNGIVHGERMGRGVCMVCVYGDSVCMGRGV